MVPDRMDTIVSLSKRRGFVYPSSDIYGGLRSSWDYGPLGVELKNNVKREWWKAVVQGRDDLVGLDSSVILAPVVWETSGHVAGFSDPLTECLSCHTRHRADHLVEAYEARHHGPPAHGLADIACPSCGTKGAFTEPKNFNLMFKTFLGPVEDESSVAYLRPETAQGNFIFRTREFEQMEMEFFVPPAEADRWFGYWREERMRWYVELGIDPANLR